MFRSTSAAVVATLSFAALAAKPSAADEHTMVALQTNHPVVTAAVVTAFDDYEGVYEAANGATFVVVRDGDSLAIELPDSIALPMRSSGNNFVLDASVVQITFETVTGDAARLVLSRSSGETVVATRVPLRRGVVSIHDI